MDGDGTDELVIGDKSTVHDGLADSDTNCPSSTGSDCGEIYVYAVGTATGDLGSPDTSPSALKHTLRGVSDNETFGQTIGVLKAPNAASGDVADWILVETGSTDIFYVLRAAHQAEASCRRSIQSLAVVQMLWAITTDSVLTFEATMMRTRLRRIAWAILMAQIRTI